jgi:predicted AAA+ superfamily ATPase
MDIDKAEEIMKESRTLEFKESVTNAFLKTVSAYANYGTGEIRFGVTDTGKEKGIEKSDKELEMGAEQFALARGGRSPRCAKQYIESLFC